MKKKFFVFLFLGTTFILVAQGKNFKSNWQSKNYNEKINYIEGFFDCGFDLGTDIENSISKQEKQNKLSKKTGDYIEIPVMYISFAIGNAQKNGIDSIIAYLDECYNSEQLCNYSVYQLLVATSRSNFKNLKQFQWIFDE